MGLTQVDFGLVSSWVSLLGVSDRIVVERGFNCSARDGFCFWVSANFGGDLDELQEMKNLLVCNLLGEENPTG